MAKKLIRLKYPSADRFIKDYPLIGEGKVFIPSKKPSPEKTELSLEIVIPGIDQTFCMDGMVIKSISPEDAKRIAKPGGMLISFTTASRDALDEMELELGAVDEYRERLGLAGPLELASEAAEAELEPSDAPEKKKEHKQEEEEETAEAVSHAPKARGHDDEEPIPLGDDSHDEGLSSGMRVVMKPVAPAGEAAVTETPEKKPKARIREDMRAAAKDEGAKKKDEPRVRIREDVRAGSPDSVKKADKPSGEKPGGKKTGGQEAGPKAEQKAEAKQKPAETESGGGLDLEWVRMVVVQEAVEPAGEEAPVDVLPPAAEKKELSPEERERVKPAGDFIMDLAKAMLRSGYYAPDHPGSKDAKQGLFDQLLLAIGPAREIMLTNQETREKTDIIITGLLEEPVSVRTVVGAGMAELFVPRLRDYFNRKGLISFAIKKDITLEHFNSFVDIMSDPQVDRGENAEVGGLLTASLVEGGITEISTVFMDDMIFIEEKLPWRVEMAIHRLAKDLKVLPMFKSISEDEVKAMKVSIVQDIIRPLRHPFLLKDIVLNCYVIAKHVKDMEAEELEQTIIASFPLQMLLPTSRHIFTELEKLKEEMHKHEDNEILIKRFEGVKRILKWVARRVVLEEAPGASLFLEQLYFNEILKFEELPIEVQYRVNTIKLADDVRDNTGNYTHGLLKAASTDDAVVILECFKRVTPVMIEQGRWEVLLAITRAVDKAASETRVFAGGAGLPANPLIYLFHEFMEELSKAYFRVEKDEREMIDEIAARMGPLGIEMFIKVLVACDDRGVRKSAVDALIKRGDLSRRRIRQILDDPQQPWYLQRNAVLVLGHIGEGEEDVSRAVRFTKHSQPRLREEALNTAIRLKGRGAEPLVVKALRDRDRRVQRRAVACLSLFRPPSEQTILKIVEMIKEPAPKEKEELDDYELRVSQLMRALGGIPDLPALERVEDAILDVAREKTDKKGGLLSRFRKAIDQEQKESPLLTAAIDALGRIGGLKSALYLEDIAESDVPQAKMARDAANRIRLRIDG